MYKRKQYTSEKEQYFLLHLFWILWQAYFSITQRIYYFFSTDLLANQGPKIRTVKVKKKAIVDFFFTLKGKRVYPLSTTDGFKCSDYKILRVKWFNYRVNTASSLGWDLSVKTTDGVVQTLGQCLTRTLHSYCSRVFHGA